MKINSSKIKRLRESLGETQAEFAQRFAGRVQTVSDWETGATKPGALSQKILNELFRDVVLHSRIKKEEKK